MTLLSVSRKTTLLITILAASLVLAAGAFAQTSPYAPNVTSHSSTPVTVGSSGTASVDNTATTGVAVSLSGLTGVSSATVTTESLNSPSTGVSTFSSGGVYFDAQVTLPAGKTAPAGATATVCFTDPSVTSSSTLQYWSGSAWTTATSIIVTGTQICGSVPLSALTGTNFVVAPAPAADYTLYYIAGIVVVVVVIALAVVMMRRGKKT